MADLIRALIIRRRETDEIVLVKKNLLGELQKFIDEQGGEYAFPEYSISLVPVFDSMQAALGSTTAPFHSIHGFTLWRDFWVEPDTHTIPVDAESMTDQNIIDFLGRNGAGLFVVAGEFNCKIYTRRFADALKEYLDLAGKLRPAKDGIPILMIVCGPIVMHDGTSDKPWEGSVLSDLIHCPDVAIYVSPHRQRFHYRLADYEVYYEDPHAPHELARVSHEAKYDWEALRIHQRRRDELLLKIHLSDTDPEKIRRCTNAATDFEYLTKDQLSALSRKMGDAFDDKTLDDMRDDIAAVKAGKF